MPRPSWRRSLAAWRVVLACCAGIGASTVGQACTAPLPTEELRSLDRLAAGNALEAVRQASALLARTPPTDTLRAAQLWAVIAEAQEVLADDAATRAAVRKALGLLAQRPGDQDALRLESRLRLAWIDSAETEAELRQATRELTALEPRMQATPLERGCFLVVRSRVESLLHLDEEASLDALRANRLVSQSGDRAAIGETESQLAQIYHRAGLTDEVMPLADRAVDDARAAGLLAALDNALYFRAEVLNSVGRHAEALQAASEMQALSERLADSIGMGFAELERCHGLFGLQRYALAAQACRSAAARLRASGRVDQSYIALHQLARIDAAQGRPADALRRIDRLLQENKATHFITDMSTYHLDRAELLLRVGRPAEAGRDLAEGVRLTRQSRNREGSLLVAVRKAELASEREAMHAQELEQAAQLRDAQARRHEATLRLAAGLAALVALIAAVLCHSLWMRRRQERALAYEERIADLVRTNSLLRRINDRLASSSRASPFLRQVLIEMQTLLGAAAACCYEYDSDGARLRLLAASPVQGGTSVGPGALAPAEIPTAELDGIWNRLASTQQLVQVRLDGPDGPDPALPLGAWLRTLGCAQAVQVPLLGESGVTGLICLVLRAPEPPEDMRLELVKLLAQQASIALRLSRLGEMASSAALLQERARIARDLHDTMAQSFTGIFVQLQAAAGYADRDGRQSRECLERAMRLAKEGLRDARRSVMALAQRGEDFDLQATLSTMADLATTGTSCRCTVHSSGKVRRIDAVVGSNLLAVCREAIGNAQRYAEATELEIALNYLDSEVEMQVRDNGRGFQVDQAMGHGLGLAGMRARALGLGGQIRILSRPGAGTTIVLRVPDRVPGSRSDRMATETG